MGASTTSKNFIKTIKTCHNHLDLLLRPKTNMIREGKSQKNEPTYLQQIFGLKKGGESDFLQVLAT